MEITLNTYSKDAYEFAQNYLHSHRDRSSAWTNEPAVSAFDIAVSRHKYDDQVFDIKSDVFNFFHIIISEEYVKKYRPTYKTMISRSSNINSFLREAGIRKPQTPNSKPLRPFEPFTKKKTNGGRTKRRYRTRSTRNRTRCRHTRHFSKKS